MVAATAAVTEEGTVTVVEQAQGAADPHREEEETVTAVEQA
jgi:hypothetical protein